MNVLDSASDFKINSVLFGIVVNHLKGNSFEHRSIVNCLVSNAEVSHAGFVRAVEGLDLGGVYVSRSSQFQ